MTPLIFIDVETTGLDPANHSIIQLSGIIKAEGEEREFDFRMAPYKGDRMTQIAIDKTGLNDDIISTYPDQTIAYSAFIALLNEYNIGSSYANKAPFVGYNSEFDMRFIRDWFEFNHDTKFGYRFWWPDIDVARLAALYLMPSRPTMRGFKLTDVYSKIFGEVYNGAHDAMSDIIATKRLFEYLTMKMLFEPSKITNSIPTRKI